MIKIYLRNNPNDRGDWIGQGEHLEEAIDDCRAQGFDVYTKGERTGDRAQYSFDIQEYDDDGAETANAWVLHSVEGVGALMRV